MGGHSHDRSVPHRNGGISYAHSLTNAMQRAPRLEALEDAWLLDLAVVESEGERKIAGALVYHAAEGEFIAVRTPAVVLACGGASTLYFPNTDTMRGCGAANGRNWTCSMSTSSAPARSAAA